jgi:hypothetical protein
METLRDRVVVDGPRPVLRYGAAPVGDLVSRLVAGEAPAKLLFATGLGPADLVAALGHAALGGDDSQIPTLVQTRPRLPRLAGALAEAAWVPIFPGAPHRLRLVLAAGLLQIHDFWEPSHEAAQEADNQGERAFSAYWHGIAHRREPDSGNAAYWFRKVGKHAVFAPLAVAARPLLEAHADSQLTGRLLANGAWNPMAMIDLCTEARPGSPRETLARQLQRVEMWLLLEATFASLS